MKLEKLTYEIAGLSWFPFKNPARTAAVFMGVLADSKVFYGAMRNYTGQELTKNRRLIVYRRIRGAVSALEANARMRHAVLSYFDDRTNKAFVCG